MRGGQGPASDAHPRAFLASCGEQVLLRGVEIRAGEKDLGNVVQSVVRVQPMA
jgi:hypothetical protein